MANYKIRPIPMIRTRGYTYKFTFLVGYGSPDERIVYSWYIEGPKENVLIDAGCMVEGLVPQPAMFPFDDKPQQIQTIDQGLAKFGLKPEDIDVIILTHLHEDHIQLARSYPNARFIVQKAEFEAARNPHPVQRFAYLRDTYDDINYELIEGDQQIMDGIRVIFSPGHAAGSQSVAVDTSDGVAIVTGFCCIHRNFKPPEGLPEELKVIPTGINLSAVQIYDTMLKLKDQADIIVPIHDAGYMEVDSIP